MELMDSKTMRIAALNIRKKVSKVDDQELWDRIKENANDGEFELYFVHNKENKYPTISNEMIKQLKKKGYKVKVWYKKGWDNLHRFYKGGLSVTWYK